MRTARRVLGLALLFPAAGVSYASAQTKAQTEGEEYYSEVGDLNTWTTEPVYRQRYGVVPDFLKVRFGQHKNFDRVVFDLIDKPVGYFISYGKPPFQGEASEEVTRVRGKAFVEIGLYPVTSTDENIEANERLIAKQLKTRMPLIRDVQTVEWFEGEIRYVVGLNRRTPFRVLLLSNPTRLVVDFKR